MSQFDLGYLIGSLANVSVTLLLWILYELSKEEE